MPIITRIGRKAWKIRLLIWSIYTILTIGSVTMIYPFTMMISLSLSSRADFKENRLVPRWFASEDALFRKFASTKYDDDVDIFNRRHKSRYADFGYGGRFKALSVAGANWPRIVAVRFDLSDPRIAARIADYDEFKLAFVKDHMICTDMLYRTTRSQCTINPLLDRYIAFLLGKYGSLGGINKAYHEETRELREIFAIRERPIFKTYLPGKGRKFEDWKEFKEQVGEKDLEFLKIADVESEWGRYLQSIYGTEEHFNKNFGTKYTAFYEIPLSFTLPEKSPAAAAMKLRDYWIKFAKNRVPLRFMSVAGADGPYRKFLKQKYGTIENMNGIYFTKYSSFDDVSFPSEISYNSTITNDIYTFIASDLVKPGDIAIKGPRWYWMEFLKKKYGTLDAANKAHSISYESFGEITLPRRLPLDETPSQQADWKDFVTNVCPTGALLDNFKRANLRSFVESEYGTVEALNNAWGTHYKRIRDVRLPRRGHISVTQEKDLRRMLSEQFTPIALVTIPAKAAGNLDATYRDYLKTKYKTLEAYNRAIRLYPAWEAVERPINEVEWADYRSKRGLFIRGYLTGNYKAVVNYMALHGRAFLNTIVLCTSMILAALTVNPLCAYALSRFQLSYANSILLFLLATMAFPVAVTQIPNFLLLRDLHLLNTYWALILPGLANGYSIFLLKGFFDSLPQELFEAGLIDGASEVQMFYRIALPLTKPVLAVIALGAFTLAYGQFMWAFIVCQNPKYWTVMVFLYQFQQDYAVPLVMAGLVLASLPTLLVFIAAQKVILRGIVIPQMK